MLGFVVSTAVEQLNAGNRFPQSAFMLSASEVPQAGSPYSLLLVVVRVLIVILTQRHSRFVMFAKIRGIQWQSEERVCHP